ncbi:unnamed protein product [Ranitomeya imitator]|uniref:Uncharacterized protein n=1 Tax=Ranitomeya imitator TaxID=111125 RepID=A0ABN9M100_9NEOB|nr:unnamed protein product [Ranitomeya imitator]
MKNSSAAMDYFGNFLDWQRVARTNCVIAPSDLSVSAEDAEDTATLTVERGTELHLMSSFNEITVPPNVPDLAPCKEASSPCLTVQQSIRKKLELDLLTVSEQLLNSYSSETTPPESLVRCASLLTGVLACYCHAEVISEDEACQSSLFQKAKMLMQCVGESTSIVKGRLGEEPKIVSLGALISQCLSCVCSCTKTGPARFSADLFLRLLTTRMLTDLCEICRHLVTNNGTTAEAVDADPIDIDREARMDIEDQGDADFFGDHSSNEATENIESGELQNITGAVSPLSEEHLTKPEMVLSQTLQFLCFCASTAISHNVNFRPSDIRRRLLNLIDTSLDTSRPLHLRVSGEENQARWSSNHLNRTSLAQTYMLLQLLNDLPVKDVALPIDDVNILLKSVPDVCSAYRRDQEVCSAILRNLLPLVRCLGQDEEDTEEKSDAEGQLLSVIYAFWHLTKDGKYTAAVRVALVNSMKTLIEVDPHSKWTIFTVGETDLTVRDAFSEFLADPHQQVRMLAAQAANSSSDGVTSLGHITSVENS